MNSLPSLTPAWPALVLAAMLAAGAAHADVTFNVNTVADRVDDNTSDGLCHTSTNTCSLRAAVMQANHLSNLEPVLINLPAGIYVLTLPLPAVGGASEAWGDLNLTGPATNQQRIVISGVSADSTIIDGNDAERVFTIDPTRFATISRVTIRGGNSEFSGGGIRNGGNLTLFLGVVENNASSGDGGGIQNFNGDLLVKASTVRSNNADRDGGGIYSVGNGNRAEILTSTVNANHADYGGGIFNDGDQLLVVNSTISANTADTDGGGILNTNAAFIYNSTIVDNDADEDHDQMGGIGGGVYALVGSRLLVTNSLIAANYATAYVNENDCDGTLEVYGWNLLGYIGPFCSFSGNGGTAHGLVTPTTIGPLRDNGGPTWTHALLTGSQAIDSTTPQGCVDENLTALSVDQRGGHRPTGLRCDVGAFEYGATPPVTDRIFAHGFDPIPF